MSDEVNRIQARWHVEELERVWSLVAEQRVLLQLHDVEQRLQRRRRLQDSELETLQDQIDELMRRRELTVRQSKLDRNLELEEYHVRRQSLLDRAEALGIGIRAEATKRDR